mgnify:CR=1 FL=1
MQKITRALAGFGVWSLLLMIPLHFLILQLNISLFGVAPAVFFLGFAMLCFGAGFVLQFFFQKTHIQELLFGSSLSLGGLSTIGFDYVFTAQPAMNEPITIAIAAAFMASVFGTLIFGLWSPKNRANA